RRCESGTPASSTVDATQVAVEVGPDVAHEREDAAVPRSHGLDGLVGQQLAHPDRIDPPSAIVLVADRHLAVAGQPTPVGQLEALAPVHPDRVGADQLQLALDLEAALLAELAPGRVLGELVALDRATGQEPLAAHGAAGPAEQQDLLAPLHVHD